MDWDDFSGSVRKKLVESHLSGRRQAPVTPPSINLVRFGDDDMCLSEEWTKWAACSEYEAFVSTMSLGGGEEEE
eukprot:2791375-Prorocentrum_lima.AAC.1